MINNYIDQCITIDYVHTKHQNTGINLQLNVLPINIQQWLGPTGIPCTGTCICVHEHDDILMNIRIENIELYLQNSHSCSLLTF